MPAKTAKELRGEGLSLYLFRYSGGLKAFLYDGNALLATVLEELLLNDAEEESEGVRIPKKQKQLWTNAALAELDGSEVGYGMIDGSWNRSCGAFEVELVAAERGYGPFMYDVAGSVFKWIMSDRQTVSSQALYVWEWMKKHPELYTSKYIADPEVSDPFDVGATKDNPCVPYTEEEVLLYAYRPKNSKMARTKALVNNHKKVVAKLREKGVSANTVNDWFARAAEDMFRSKHLF